MRVDTRVARAGLAQVFALLGPFVYLGVALKRNGSAVALTSEVVLSLVGLYAIIIDWSATTFLARMHRRLLSSGAYFSVVAARLAGALLIAFLTVLARPLVCSALDARLSLLVFTTILVGVAIDPSWIFVGRKQVWVPQAVSACRFFIGTSLALCGLNPIVGLALAFPGTSL